MRRISAPIGVAMLTLLSAGVCLARSTPISKADMGAQWPLKVDAGVLDCTVVGQLSNGEPIGTVTFTAKGRTYAVNGIAKGHAKKHGWRDVDEIWKKDPANPGLKINIGPLISRGLALCE